MDLIHGFKCILETEVAEYASTARIYEHAATGGRLLSMENKDENKVFGISFRTPPADSTGLPHILEHSVLCGSEKYPVKEPFVELLKGSLQTFLNALTFPDKTCYPVASTNHQDFNNLVDVYLDAVFFPRLTPDTLKQEGWHFEPGPNFEADGELVYKGVVFNEMKGAYSSPDGLLSEHTQNSLFPDNCYSLDSGGDPAVIPELTFEQFEDFHRRYYHPSNAWAFFYGDDDPEQRLKALDAYFSRFERSVPSPEIALQPPLAAPVRLVKPYAASEGDSQAMFTMNFGLPETADPNLNLRLDVLEHILIGLPSSPLRKALLDSGLGEDLTGVGLETDLRQMYFSVGLKGIEEADIAEAETVIEQVLVDLADSVHPHDIEAGINSLEFDLRENNTGSYPRGLSLMFRALSTWLYGNDPLALLAFEAPLAKLKKEVDDGKPVFEKLIRTHLLENTHRSVVILRPDPELAGQQAAEEAARLRKAAEAMDKDGLARVAVEAQALHDQQGRHDSPEALATIPRLL
ncbi:MAG: insulinase family protein, partial [Proteobacteria bacterium]|nr:insulinase family protein [Pseudomonadota bacterium]MBU1612650.1 insulinase family protein [Pseudomonadota bacterium]